MQPSIPPAQQDSSVQDKQTGSSGSGSGGPTELPLRAATRMSEEKVALSKAFLGMVFGCAIQTRENYEEVCNELHHQDVPDWDTFRALGDQQFLVRPHAVGGPSNMSAEDFQKYSSKWCDWRFTPVLDWQSEHNTNSPSKYRYSKSTYRDAVMELELKLEADFDSFRAWCGETPHRPVQDASSFYESDESKTLRHIKEVEKGFSLKDLSPSWFCNDGVEPPVPLAVTTRNYNLFMPERGEEEDWISPPDTEAYEHPCEGCHHCIENRHCTECKTRRARIEAAERNGKLADFVLKQDSSTGITECFRGHQLGYLVEYDKTCIPIAFKIDDTLTIVEGVYIIDPRKVELYGRHWELFNNWDESNETYMTRFGTDFDVKELDKIFEGCLYRGIDVENGQFTGDDVKIDGQVYVEPLFVD